MNRRNFIAALAGIVVFGRWVGRKSVGAYQYVILRSWKVVNPADVPVIPILYRRCKDDEFNG